ncbi:hypothetical protein [Clostridium botulinum]|nr:hypothetical protein [Clostridium botulinum]MBY6809393.1 hypothetical protein [Clostridium botulinum]MBY6822835.1 hypothetical protein [Clostridium botulinum]MBY6833447.1 hypothetical protein [Clostridium botulinum]MBY6971508.1 hypothetical protein [Clostridium botulinum]HBJ1649175.1 hypothetical protein [Clostridium botulinum]
MENASQIVDIFIHMNKYIGMIIISILPAVIVFINEKRKNSSVQKI